MLRHLASIFVALMCQFSMARGCWDDQDLAQFKAKHPTAPPILLYVWSPKMALSAQHAASAQRQAAALGVDFVALHDASVPHGELQAALQRLQSSALAHERASAVALSQSRALCATDLIARDALRHFPTAFVVQPHGLHRFAIVGAMPEAAWASSIAQRLDTPQ
jgi:hypothetical protein